MSDDGGYHDDDFRHERDWRRGPQDADWLRLASNLLIGVGLAAGVAWMWLTLRTQGLVGEYFSNAADLSLAERLDVVAGTLDDLVVAAIAIGLGLAARHHAERGEP